MQFRSAMIALLLGLASTASASTPEACDAKGTCDAAKGSAMLQVKIAEPPSTKAVKEHAEFLNTESQRSCISQSLSTANQKARAKKRALDNSCLGQPAGTMCNAVIKTGKCALPTDGRMTDCQYRGGTCEHLMFCDIGQYAACAAGKPESCTLSGGSLGGSLEGTCEHVTTTGMVSGMQKIFECKGLHMPEPEPTPEPEKPGPGPFPNSLESPAAKGSKELAVVSNAGFDIGVDIVIDAGTPIEEHNKVVGFGSLILESPLQYDHGTGAIITTASSVGSGATASLDAAGFKAVTSLCCPVEMEAFFNRLLDKEGYSVCSKPHIQGLMHWFSCVPDMDFQYMLDVIAKGNPCKYWSPKGTDCPALSAYCQGEWCR